MKTTHAKILLVLLAVFSPLCGLRAQEAKNVDEAMKAVRSFEMGDSRMPVYTVRDAVYASTSSPEKKAAMEQELLELLDDPESTYLCRKLVCHD